MCIRDSFKVPCQIGAGGKKFQIIFFLRINDRSTAQKSCANVCTDAGLTADKAGIDLQAGLAAVSYTHLVQTLQDGAVSCITTQTLSDLIADVAGLDAGEDKGVGPVSYTHLDVYKRQV